MLAGNPTGTSISEQPAPGKTNVARGVVRWSIRETMGLVMWVLFLLLPVGMWNKRMAWAQIVVTAMWILGTAVAIIPRHPELLAEQVGPRKGGKAGDTEIVGVIGVLMLAKMLPVGLDVRFGRTGGLPIWAEIGGTVAAVAGYGLAVWEAGSNAFLRGLSASRPNAAML